jgi:peroxiredoxin/uncharacterized membrane protein YphA (DoxX/SURF4 family)
MGIALLIARVLLAIVFGVAGVAKLLDRAGTRDALRNFRVPPRLVPSFAILLPAGELLVALSLFRSGFAWWGALGAFLLLLVFIAAISLNLAQGRKPKCRCFGQLHSAPVGWPTLVRNFILAGTAGVVLAQGQDAAAPDVLNWIGGLSVAQRAGLLFGTILAALLAVAFVGLVQILRQQGRLMRRLEILESQFAHGVSSAARTVGLSVGTPAPAFALPNLNGEVVTLDSLRNRGLPVVLVFWDPDCHPCEALLPELGRWQRDHADQLTIVPISRGSVESNLGKVRKHGLATVLLQQEHEIDDAYGIDATPTAVLVRQDGTVGSPQAGGADKIYSLMAGILGQLGPSPLLTTSANAGNGHAAASLPT